MYVSLTPKDKETRVSKFIILQLSTSLSVKITVFRFCFVTDASFQTIMNHIITLLGIGLCIS